MSQDIVKSIYNYGTHIMGIGRGRVSIIVLGIHIYADQPRAHKVCIISLESEYIKLTCIDNL